MPPPTYDADILLLFVSPGPSPPPPSLLPGWRGLAASRRVQAGFKYWVATGSVLLLTLALTDTDSQVGF
jgi:hypothetical protein